MYGHQFLNANDTILTIEKSCFFEMFATMQHNRQKRCSVNGFISIPGMAVHRPSQDWREEFSPGWTECTRTTQRRNTHKSNLQHISYMVGMNAGSIFNIYFKTQTNCESETHSSRL